MRATGRTSLTVMAGLAPAIHVLEIVKKDVDARPKACARAGRASADPCAGHDDLQVSATHVVSMSLFDGLAQPRDDIDGGGQCRIVSRVGDV